MARRLGRYRSNFDGKIVRFALFKEVEGDVRLAE